MTKSLLAELDDPKRYAVEPEAEVFDEHTRYKPDPKTGKPTSEVLKQFTRADLEAFAAGTNQRDREGSPCAMTIGHTIDDAPEDRQPPIVGYWRKFRVAFSKARDRWVLMATPYVQCDRLEEARSYPRSSPEAWGSRSIMDPIAILRRTPDRPTQWTFAARTAGRYKMASAEQRYRYAMEPPMPDPTGADPLDPTMPPDAAAPDQEFQDKFAACMQSMYPHMQEMHEKYAAASAAPGAAPAMTTPNAAAPEAPPEAGERFSALEQENKAIKERFSALEAANGELEKKLRHRDRRAEVDAKAGLKRMEVAKEFEACKDLPAEQYAAYVQRFDSYPDRNDPTAGPTIDTSGPAVEGGAFDEARLRIAEKYMADESEKLKGLPHEQAWARARKFAMTGKSD